MEINLNHDPCPSLSPQNFDELGVPVASAIDIQSIVVPAENRRFPHPESDLERN